MEIIAFYIAGDNSANRRENVIRGRKRERLTLPVFSSLNVPKLFKV